MSDDEEKTLQLKSNSSVPISSSESSQSKVLNPQQIINTPYDVDVDVDIHPDVTLNKVPNLSVDEMQTLQLTPITTASVSSPGVSSQQSDASESDSDFSVVTHQDTSDSSPPLQENAETKEDESAVLEKINNHYFKNIQFYLETSSSFQKKKKRKCK